MVNNIILVGRIANKPEPVELDDGRKVMSIDLAVMRNYKNEEGIYETDFIKCVIWNGIAETTAEYCHVGDVIGVKGRLQTDKYEDKDGNKRTSIEVIAERITFLSSRSRNVEKELDNEER